MKYKHRLIEAGLFEAFKNPFVTCILGPRRVGKSTLIDYFISQSADIEVVRLNMDKMSERDTIKAGKLEAIILTSIKRHLEANRRIWVTIDEAQKCPELFEQVKLLYDRYKDQDAIKFILTGSALLQLHRLSAESLAGRIQLYYLSAFGLAETAACCYDAQIPGSVFDLIETPDNLQNWELHLRHLLPFTQVLKEALSDLQIWGGLPEVLELTTPSDRLNYISNYLQTYLEKDVRAIESITDLQLYRHLMNIAAEQTGSLKDDQRILQALGCHRDTLNKYRGFLQATLLYKEVHPYINASLKRLVKTPKACLINNGLISYLQGLHDDELLRKTGHMGHRLENWFLNELIIWLSKTPDNHEIYYWRTSGGAEVDFIVKKGSAIYPFEITLATYIEPKKVQNLLRFREYEPKARFCFYVYMGEFKFDELNNIVFIPAWVIT